MPKCTACCVEIAVGRPKGAATIETTRHYKLNRAPRYYRPRASACRRAPPTEWTSRAFGCRGGPQRSSKCAIALWEARARAERPPLWGSDDVSAMRNYRYRHRDSPYVARRSGERTSRAGRPWAVGGELPGARWRGRPVCARCGRLCKGQRRHQRARVGFFIHIHPRLRRAGRRRGGKADRSVQRPVILVRCVGHGGGARGVGAVGRHARGGVSGTGRAGQRGERCAGA